MQIAHISRIYRWFRLLHGQTKLTSNHNRQTTSRFHNGRKLAVGQTSDGCRMFADPNRIHALIVRAAPTLSSRFAGGRTEIPIWEWRTCGERNQSTRS
jgi:hypothetical protein